MTHTSTPWKIGKHGSIVTDNPDDQVAITGQHADETIAYYGGHVICETVTKENAAFIIRACNNIEAAEARATELAAQLATAQSALERVTLERDNAEAWLQVAKIRVTELEAAQAESDKAKERLVYLFDHLKVWLGAKLIGDDEP